MAPQIIFLLHKEPAFSYCPTSAFSYCPPESNLSTTLLLNFLNKGLAMNSCPYFYTAPYNLFPSSPCHLLFWSFQNQQQLPCHQIQWPLLCAQLAPSLSSCIHVVTIPSFVRGLHLVFHATMLLVFLASYPIRLSVPPFPHL